MFINFILIIATVFFVGAEESLPVAEKPAGCSMTGEIRDVVGPATYDYLQRLVEKTKEDHCSSIYLKINTPGGSLQSTRKIVELIMSSPVPILCLIYPSGGHAGSAGAIIMQACHVNGGMEATNIGAATPISGMGEEIPDDLKRKLYEDTRSWVEGLAKFRGRSVDFAKEIVVSGKALDARDAVKEKAIDVVVASENDFLKFAEGKMVKTTDDNSVEVKVGALTDYPPDLRHDILQVLSNPQWAYLIFMASLGLIYFELTHPGVFLPGVVGAMGLVISLINFHMLDVSWGAVALIILGLGFMFAELFVPSFGALGIGGIVSVTIGSLFLFDEKKIGQVLPYELVFSTSFMLALVAGGLTYLAYQAIESGRLNRLHESWQGRKATVKNFDSAKKRGMVFIDGELWKCQSNDVLNENDEVIIESVKGLTLVVAKA